MDTLELQYILDHDRWLSSLHAKVCARDQLPTLKPGHVKAYIVNTDISSEPGEHWVAIFFKDHKAIYFDSYGLPPIPEWKRFMDNNSGTWIFNQTRLQGLSFVCGIYCLYVLSKLNQGYTLTDIITRNQTSYINDIYVYQWFFSHHTRLYKLACLSKCLNTHIINQCCGSKHMFV